MAALPEIGQSLLVDRKNLSDHYKEVQSFHIQRATTQKRISRFLVVVAGVALAANLAQAWTIAGMLPLSKLVPVYLWVRPDGTIDSSISMSQLPPTENKAVVDASLWEYVRARESFSTDTAQHNYDVVTNYSAEDVAEQYQNWFNYPSKVSPQVTIGDKGSATVSHISSADISPTLQQIRFTRTLSMKSAAPVVITMTATVGYAKAKDMPAETRLTNPGGLVVTSYQVSEDTPK